uniref:Uncharacterized protein n=1 Tax=Chromera velia CCMP2878 TaxID=1169474 RepID=A0A0G4I4Z4_9ALVE|eukprot:Cvel_11038.t1-p1 / transcript=Cvel_11038.t1 / gene=Cvel_11038 / organism=Chromera_velia_CCMP2878 / gene_product=Zinc finger protein 420, putative / transcript_product=Zinc finger protein 420, putative / location=Cvel_scaffold680:71332-73203(-) / protein_length=624 / sequence_SO=supercontig / SO=protein_coding / is_pseudo=false
MCLEPLRGGDFRIVRLVSGPSLSDCSSVGERGVNTLHVGAEGGRDHQKRELVGISVEWGVPESLQLALLSLHTDRQTENPDRTIQSEVACPLSAQHRTQTDTRIFDSDSHHTSVSVSICDTVTESAVCPPAQAAVKLTQSGGQRREREEGNRLTKETCEHRDLRSHRPNSSSHMQEEEAQGQSEMTQNSSVVPQKRRRSESALTQMEADECDEVSGCSGERRGVGLWGEGRGRGCVREEKQRRLTVSLSDSAPLSSEVCRGRDDPIAGWKAVVYENDRRGGEGGEVKRNRHGQILCLHGRVRCRCKDCDGKSICQHGRQRHSCKVCGGKGTCEHGRQRSHCKECGGKSICEHGRARSKCKECGGTSICDHGRIRSQCKECGGKSICDHGRIRYQCKECGGGGICEHGRHRARSAEGRVFVITAVFAITARSAEGRAYVSTVASAASARSAEGKAFASKVASAASARIVEEGAFVSTVAGALGAKIAEGRVFVSTESSATTARSAEGRAYVSTVVSAASSRSAEARAFVSTAGSDTRAGSAGGRVFVSTVAGAPDARNVAGRVFVSTAGTATFARSAEGGALVFTERTADAAVSASRSLLFLLDPCVSLFTSAVCLGSPTPSLFS